MISNKKNDSIKIDNVVLNGVLSIIENNGPFQGTMTELSSTLRKTLNKQQSKIIPESPSHLRVVLNRVIFRLRNRKVKVRFSRSNKMRSVKMFI